MELTLRGDRTVKAVAEELRIPAGALYEWRRLYAARIGASGPAPHTLAQTEEEIPARNQLLDQ